MTSIYADVDTALFADLDEPPATVGRKPSGVPEATLVILAEIALKEADYPEGVPAVGMAKEYQLDRIAERGLIERLTLADRDIDEGPRRLRLTESGRAAIDQYDSWATRGGFTTMRDFVRRHVMGVIA